MKSNASQVRKAFASVSKQAIMIWSHDLRWYFFSKANESIIGFVEDGTIELHDSHLYNPDKHSDYGESDDWEIIYWHPELQVFADNAMKNLYK